ncbi:sphingosine kinase 2 isoform X3 [Megachile rotundata]|uniref:sphingosine kinase 2 isoform X3 n=1 Tax=Megachile rotundata TaxID=143995 RepID=UPI003FD0F533
MNTRSKATEDTVFEQLEEKRNRKERQREKEPEGQDGEENKQASESEDTSGFSERDSTFEDETINTSNESHITADHVTHLKGERRRPNNTDTPVKTTCFNCKREGHTAKQCDKPKGNRCFRCDEVGHYAKYCKSAAVSAKQHVSKEQTPVAKGSVLHIQPGQNHAKYFKDAYINGNHMRCYVDLGSSCVALREDVAQEAGLTYLEGSFGQLTGYGDGTVTPVGMMTARITIDGVEARAQIHVVPKKCQVIPLIVGHPFTEQEDIEIISRPNELIIKKVNRPIEGVESERSKTPLWSTEEMIIPNNYLGCIAAHTEINNQDICIEGGVRNDGQLIPRCIISTDSEGRSLIPVLNISGADLHIKERTALSRGEVVEEGHEPADREVNVEPIKLDEVNTDLPKEEAEHVVSILNDFKDLIARNIRQVGHTNMAEMKISLMDATPIAHRPYRVSQYERRQINDIVAELKQADIIEDSDSPFSSPVLLVRKKTGDVRMCVDYRALNRQTIKQLHPIPHIDDNLDGLQDVENNSNQVMYGPSSRLPALISEVSSSWTQIQGEFVMVHAAYQSHLGQDYFFAPRAKLADGIIWLVIVKAGITRANLLQFQRFKKPIPNKKEVKFCQIQNDV